MMKAPYGAAAWLELAETKTTDQLMKLTGISRRAVYERNKRVGVTPKTIGRPPTPVPEGFAEAELGVTLGVLANRYDVSVDTIRRWSVEVMQATGKSARQRYVERQHATFLEKHTGDHFYIAAKRLHVAVQTVAKWAVAAGVASPKSIRLRERARRIAEAKANSPTDSPPSRASWFETDDCPLPRDLWVQAVKPWCPAWEMEEEQAYV